jgi:hypothetical protein
MSGISYFRLWRACLKPKTPAQALEFLSSQQSKQQHKKPKEHVMCIVGNVHHHWTMPSYGGWKITRKIPSNWFDLFRPFEHIQCDGNTTEVWMWKDRVKEPHILPTQVDVRNYYDEHKIGLLFGSKDLLSTGLRSPREVEISTNPWDGLQTKIVDLFLAKQLIVVGTFRMSKQNDKIIRVTNVHHALNVDKWVSLPEEKTAVIKEAKTFKEMPLELLELQHLYAKRLSLKCLKISLFFGSAFVLGYAGYFPFIPRGY